MIFFKALQIYCLILVSCPKAQSQSSNRPASRPSAIQSPTTLRPANSPVSPSVPNAPISTDSPIDTSPASNSFQPTPLSPVFGTTKPASNTANSDSPVTTSPVANTPVTSTPIVPTQAPVVAIPATSAPVTKAPVTKAPVTKAPVTKAPVTKAPITLPPTTLAPVTAAPTTVAPSTAAPTTDKPVTIAPTKKPTLQPSRLPTGSPSALPTEVLPSPSVSPSTTPSLKPNNSPILFEGPLTGLKMTLTGLSMMSDASIKVWEDTTDRYFEDFYSDSGNSRLTGASNVRTRITVTGQSKPNAVRHLLGRVLQRDEAVVITYTQNIAFSPGNSQVVSEDIAAGPFDTTDRRTEYVKTLRSSGDDAFATLTTATEVLFPSKPDPNGVFTTPVIIGIAVGGSCVLLFLIFIISLWVKKRSKSHEMYIGAADETPPTQIGAGQDDVSTLVDPVRHKNSKESLAGYGDQSVATVDYDYSKAYGGGNDHSVSSAGGTFGSNPNALGANQGVIAAGGAATLGSFYSDDGSFGGVMGGAKVREEVIHVFAPAGKLGVVIDTPDDGAPVVHAIKDSSVIADKLQVGDKLVAVDDEDVRMMTAIKVSKLISRKSANPSRKLTIVRSTLVD